MHWTFPDLPGTTAWSDVALPSAIATSGDRPVVRPLDVQLSSLVRDATGETLAVVFDASRRMARSSTASEAVEIAAAALSDFLGPLDLLLVTEPDPEVDPGSGPLHAVAAPHSATVPLVGSWVQALVLVAGDAQPLGALLIGLRAGSSAIDGVALAAVAGVAAQLGNELAARAADGDLAAPVHAASGVAKAALAVPGLPAGVLAHELRRRVAALRVVSEAIVALRDRGGEPWNLVSRLVDELEEIDRLGRDLLGQRQVNRSWVDIGEIVGRAARTVTEARHADIRVDQLPAGVRAMADATMLREALENLLENAARHGRGSPIEVTVRVGTVSVPGVEILVADSGPGLAAGVSDARQGNGIGLALVRRCVAEHGGRVWAVGRAAGGTVFGLWLPLVEHLAQAGLAGADDTADRDLRRIG